MRFYLLLYITGCIFSEQLSRNNPYLRRYLSHDYFRRKQTKPAGKSQLKSFAFASFLLHMKEWRTQKVNGISCQRAIRKWMEGLADMSADNVLGWEIVLRIYLPLKLRFSANFSFFGQSLRRGHCQWTYQPPKGVRLLINSSHPREYNLFSYLKKKLLPLT